MNDTMLNALSGIRTHQFGLDSISNNIANVNTNGFKSNSPEFKTLFSRNLDTMNSNTVTNNDFSYGVTGGSNNIITKSGNMRKVDSDTAVAFTGKGWLVVGKNKEGSFEINDDDYKMSDENFFTKNGDFTLDADGYLVNSEGYYLYGVNLKKINGNDFEASQDSNKDNEELSKGVMKPISIPPLLSYHPVETTKVDLSVNLNRTQELRNVVEAYTNNGFFNEANFFNQDFNALANSDEDMINPDIYGEGKIVITNKDGTQTITNYQYGDGTSSKGNFHTLGQLQFLIKRDTGLDLELNRDQSGVIDPKGALILKNNTGENINISVSGKFFERLNLKKDNFDLNDKDYVLGSNLSVPSFSNSTEIFDKSGKKYVLKNSFYLVNSGDNEGSQKMPEIWNVRSSVHEFNSGMMLHKETTEGVLMFDTDGKAIANTLNVPFIENDIALDLKNSTNKMYSDPGVNKTEQDGKNRGIAQNVRINENGVISLAFSNGEQEAIGRVGLATFANDQGLKKVGGNLFALEASGGSPLSGNPKLAWGDDSNLKQGKIMQGFVETSNVDVGNALTNLILMQRGYSMNAKSFTTSDDLIKEAIALKK